MLAVELATRLGVEVEVLSLRSESQTVLADAEGVLSVEDFGSPIRIQTDPEGADDGWVEVDYDLEETSDGVWAPKASPADVVVNDTVDGVVEAARVTYEDGSSVAVTWPEDNPGELGDPVVEGGVATYPLEGFSGSVDLVVAMTTTGASTWLRINEALSAEETAAIESEGVTFGLRTSGGVDLQTSNDAIAADPTLAEDVAPEALVLTDSEGEAVGATPPLVAWDSSALDEVGMPTETTLLASDLTQPGEARDSGDAGDAAEHELTVTPPAELLGGTDGAGAGVEYPVIIDPQFENLTQSQDTWIRNGVTTLNGLDMKLPVGRTSAGAEAPVSLLQFQSTVFDGRQIDEAYLGLYQYAAGTCSPRTLNVHSIRDPWAQSQTTWVNQPRIYTSNYAPNSVPNKAPSCSGGAGYVEARITPIVRDWAHGARPNRGVMVSAPAAGDTTFSRSFCSMDYNAAYPDCNRKPYLKVSYSLAIDGQRPGATRLPFTASDLIQAQVDVGTGNLMLGVNGISLPGINGSTSMMATYNSSGGREVRRLGRGWLLENTNDIRMTPRTGTIASADVVFTGPSGRTEEFTTRSTSGGVTRYNTPAGLKADLYRSSSAYELVMRESRTKYVFGAQGGLVEIRDRNGNSTTIEQSGTGTYKNITVQTPAGTNAARTARITTDLDGSSNGTTTIAQGDTSAMRSVSFARSGNNATSFTDARGRTTTFTYDANGLMTQIAAPGNVTTQFTYDDRRRVTSVTQVENAPGGPGNSVTRFTYPNRHLTLVADPTTNQSALVSQVPHTEYHIDDNNRVDKTVDPEGRERSKTYTPNSDTATSTIGASSGGGGAGGSGGSTTTNTWNGNNGDSMTETEAPTGASSSWAYEGTGMAQYNATSSTDDADNTSTYTYNGAGNQLTSADASEATAEVTRNDDGTVATATSPGNGDNDTNYGYTNHQITSMAPVTGSSLGDRAYTYDTMGRLATVTNGRGITTTYSYNENDQIVSVTHDGGGTGGSGTQTVTYGYDAAGRQNSRVDTHGTTTSTYDQLGRLLTRVNTAGGGTITYTYDKASRLASSTSTEGGTTNYAYDNAGVATGYNYPVTPGSSTRITVRFTTDDKGRRTGTYVAPNADFTTWTARTTNTYDDSGRVSRVRADRGNGTPDIIDVSYCYAFGTTPGGGCSDNDDDRAKLAWKKDNLTGDGVRYTYDETGRLTNAQPTAGGTTYSYDYNQAGARTSATSGSTTQTLTFNAAHQISTSGYTYDGAGNLTDDPASGSTNITYTPADQLNSVVKDGTTYFYSHAGDDNNELLEQSSPDGTYRYTYGRNAETGVPVVEQIHRTHNSGGSQVTDGAAVISDPLTGTPVMLKTADGIASIYVYDGTPGAPIALISDQAGQAARTAAYTYDPYGAATTAAGANPNVAAENPYTFSGNGVRDRTTNWIHYGERYYSTRTGTFTQQDTLDAPLSQTDGNRYAYAAGDPINTTDPTGRCGVKTYFVAAGGGAVTGGMGAALGGPSVGVGITGGALIGLGGAAASCGLGDAYDDVSGAISDTVNDIF